MEEDNEKKAIGKSLTVEQASTESFIFNDQRYPLMLTFDIESQDCDPYIIHFDELQSLLRDWKSKFYDSVKFENEDAQVHQGNNLDKPL